MTNLVTGLLSVLLSTNPAVAASNAIQNSTGISVEVADPKDPVDREYHRILAEDDTAQEEVAKWIKEAEEFAAKGADDPNTTLSARIKQRLDEVKKQYEAFLQAHPEHVKARVAYASFLGDINDEDGERHQLEKVIEVDPLNAPAMNNLANICGHHGPIEQTFPLYEKAISIRTNESVYYQNLAVTVYLFRKDAMEYYKCDETAVFDRALDLYRKALALDPDNFILASDYAQSFYGTKPPRWEDGLKAWQEIMKLARDEAEREGVYIHLARCNINLGHYDAAKTNLAVVTNAMYAGLKTTLTKKIAGLENRGATNEVEKIPNSNSQAP